MTDPERNRRHPDYETSVEGAYVSREAKKSQQRRLLTVYAGAGPDGLTCAEAIAWAGIPDGQGCPWKRVGELRQQGLLEWLRDDDGRIVKRPNDHYAKTVNQGVSIITATGREKAGQR
jgi:hypothetical protein